ncbi:hypothetical protein BH10CYA1_BH10CYA1_55460 [soil metagenome]
MHQKLDKTTITVLCLLALTAILLVIFMINIVDRSGEHVTAIKNTKVMGPGANFASAVNSEDDLTAMNIRQENSAHPSCTVADGTIKEAMFRKIEQIKNLRELSLKRCEFKGSDFQILEKTRIQSIHFDEANLDEQCLQAIGRLPLLRHIEMFACDLRPHALARLSDSRVRWVQLRYSQNISTNSEFTADDLGALSEIKNLTFLELERSKFAPGSFRALSKCGALALNVERCDVTDDDVIDIAKMPNLGYLNLARNAKVTCKGLRALLQSKTIQQISFTEDISKCGFTIAEQKKLNPRLFLIPQQLWQKFSDQ